MNPVNDLLFAPFSFKALKLPNRVVMAPMTRSHSPDGVPTDEVVGYYRRRAEAEVGLIITEGTTVDYASASNDPKIPSFCKEASLAGWRKVVEAVHAAGGKIAPQLWHQGVARKAGTGPQPDAPVLSPSGLAGPGKPVAQPMSIAQIEQVVRQFATAAGHARRLGFDAIELHGAHGYLIDQFFWEGTNQRDDAYGGSLLKRTRFAVEIIEACRTAVGPDLPIILRFSQWKQQDYEAKLAHTPEELEQFLTPLARAGVDIFHASTRRFWQPEFEGSELNLAGWTKKLTGKPTITVGSVGLDDDFIASFMGKGAGTAGIDQLLERMQHGEFDLVAVGRALLLDPNWARKLHRGEVDQFQPFNPAALATLS
ncbi:MAG TPA: NADH:flavin oxidoreductase [Pseudomonadales bacterium]|nr:NADH:flavin oxidoreductase [Pseudomonadales bacterium]